MNKTVRTLDYDQILKILEETEEKYVVERVTLIPQQVDDLEITLKKYVKTDSMSRKSVLGIDIYKYSSFEEFQQSLVPLVFKLLMRETIDNCFKNHTFFFQKYTKKEIEDNFISTGDGGFLIFDLPLHSLIFACNFAVVLRAYNSYHIYPKFRKIIGGLSLRYAITYDQIFYFDNSHYGRAIINNARTLSRDNLNRCLIDQNVHTWFTSNIDGLENLQILTMHEIANIWDFKGSYDYSILKSNPDAFFGETTTRERGIINSDVLKIGEIQSKETNLSIYNLHLQVTAHWERQGMRRIITISLGNLNTSHLM